jgi:hypothetical protein
MKRFTLIYLFIFFTSAFGQTKLPKSHSPLYNLTCKTCHSCDVPTREDPCLIPCPRNGMVTVYQSADKTVDIVKLDDLSKKYTPVVFQHRMHAQMSGMSGGCKTCHHYNTSGPIQPCKNCHESERKREDISKPDLEAAYHRQCINCHREWSHENNCESCHALKSANNVTANNKIDLKLPNGKQHPKLTEPTKIVYETNYDNGKIVTFRHDEHIKLFGAECISCHTEENCSKCHDKTKTNSIMQPVSGLPTPEGAGGQASMPIKIHKAEDQHHKPCFTCHQNDACTLCHLSKPAGPFNHEVRTGWALNKFHQSLSCSKCHGTSNTFSKLDNKCENCHKNFTTGKFEHKITGIILSENHKDLDCIECHKEKDFSKAPTCAGCHDDKSFPKDKPGKLVSLRLSSLIKFKK